MSDNKALILSPNNNIRELNGGDYILKTPIIAKAWEKCYQMLGEELVNIEDGQLLITIGFPSSGKTTAAVTEENLEKYDVIFDGGFNTKINRSPIIHIAKGAGWKVDCLYMTTPYKVCRNRNHRNANGQHVPFEIFKNIASGMNEPKTHEGFGEIIKINTRPEES